MSDAHPTDEERIYAQRDIRAQGAHYERHMEHLTSESLVGKSEIAAELAHRDIEIARLREALMPFAIAAHKGEQRWKILEAAEEGVMDLCDGFMDVAKRYVSVANFRRAFELLRGQSNG